MAVAVCEECGTKLVDDQCPRCDMDIDEVLENETEIEEDFDDILEEKL